MPPIRCKPKPPPAKEKWPFFARELFPDECPVCGHRGCGGIAKPSEVKGMLTVTCWHSGGTPSFHDVPMPRGGAIPQRPVKPIDYALVSNVYREFLRLCPLTEAHRTALLKRGLTEEMIRLNNFRSVPPIEPRQVRRGIVVELRRRFRQLEDVPGFRLLYFRYQIFGTRPGILIPHYGLPGGENETAKRILAIQIRQDDPLPEDQPRYLWFGQGSPTPPYFPHGFPSHCNEGRVTEGAFKAIIAQAYTGFPTVGIPGINTACAAGLSSVLRSLGVTRIRMAFDQDHNGRGQQAQTEIAAMLRADGFRVIEETWHSDFKGCDDALVAGARIIRKIKVTQ